MIFELPLEEGKYTVLYDNGKIEILRHGELWSKETGNKFLHALLMSHIELEHKLDELEQKLYEAKEELYSIQQDWHN